MSNYIDLALPISTIEDLATEVRFKLTLEQPKVEYEIKPLSVEISGNHIRGRNTPNFTNDLNMELQPTQKVVPEDYEGYGLFCYLKNIGNVEIESPACIAFDEHGSKFITDVSTKRIYRIDEDNEFCIIYKNLMDFENLENINYIDGNLYVELYPQQFFIFNVTENKELLMIDKDTSFSPDDFAEKTMEITTIPIKFDDYDLSWADLVNTPTNGYFEEHPSAIEIPMHNTDMREYKFGTFHFNCDEEITCAIEITDMNNKSWRSNNKADVTGDVSFLITGHNDILWENINNIRIIYETDASEVEFTDFSLSEIVKYEISEDKVEVVDMLEERFLLNLEVTDVTHVAGDSNRLVIAVQIEGTDKYRLIYLNHNYDDIIHWTQFEHIMDDDFVPTQLVYDNANRVLYCINSAQDEIIKLSHEMQILEKFSNYTLEDFPEYNSDTTLLTDYRYITTDSIGDIYFSCDGYVAKIAVDGHPIQIMSASDPKGLATYMDEDIFIINGNRIEQYTIDFEPIKSQQIVDTGTLYDLSINNKYNLKQTIQLIANSSEGYDNIIIVIHPYLHSGSNWFISHKYEYEEIKDPVSFNFYNDNLYICNYDGTDYELVEIVNKLNYAGKIGIRGNVETTDNPRVNAITSVVSDENFLYTCDKGANRIQKISKSDKSVVWDYTGNEIQNPVDIEVDENGNVYVANSEQFIEDIYDYYTSGHSVTSNIESRVEGLSNLDPTDITNIEKFCKIKIDPDGNNWFLFELENQSILNAIMLKSPPTGEYTSKFVIECLDENGRIVYTSTRENVDWDGYKIFNIYDTENKVIFIQAKYIRIRGLEFPKDALYWSLTDFRYLGEFRSLSQYHQDILTSSGDEIKVIVPQSSLHIQYDTMSYPERILREIHNHIPFVIKTLGKIEFKLKDFQPITIFRLRIDKDYFPTKIRLKIIARHRRRWGIYWVESNDHLDGVGSGLQWIDIALPNINGVYPDVGSIELNYLNMPNTSEIHLYQVGFRTELVHYPINATYIGKDIGNETNIDILFSDNAQSWNPTNVFAKDEVIFEFEPNRIDQIYLNGDISPRQYKVYTRGADDKLWEEVKTCSVIPGCSLHWCLSKSSFDWDNKTLSFSSRYIDKVKLEFGQVTHSSNVQITNDFRHEKYIGSRIKLNTTSLNDIQSYRGKEYTYTLPSPQILQNVEFTVSSLFGGKIHVFVRSGSTWYDCGFAAYAGSYYYAVMIPEDAKNSAINEIKYLVYGDTWPIGKPEMAHGLVRMFDPNDSNLLQNLQWFLPTYAQDAYSSPQIYYGYHHPIVSKFKNYNWTDRCGVNINTILIDLNKYPHSQFKGKIYITGEAVDSRGKMSNCILIAKDLDGDYHLIRHKAQLIATEGNEYILITFLTDHFIHYPMCEIFIYFRQLGAQTVTFTCGETGTQYDNGLFYFDTNHSVFPRRIFNTDIYIFPRPNNLQNISDGNINTYYTFSSGSDYTFAVKFPVTIKNKIIEFVLSRASTGNQPIYIRGYKDIYDSYYKLTDVHMESAVNISNNTNDPTFFQHGFGTHNFKPSIIDYDTNYLYVELLNVQSNLNIHDIRLIDMQGEHISGELLLKNITVKTESNYNTFAEGNVEIITDKIETPMVISPIERLIDLDPNTVFTYQNIKSESYILYSLNEIYKVHGFRFYKSLINNLSSFDAHYSNDRYGTWHKIPQRIEIEQTLNYIPFELAGVKYLFRDGLWYNVDNWTIGNPSHQYGQRGDIPFYCANYRDTGNPVRGVFRNGSWIFADQNWKVIDRVHFGQRGDIPIFVDNHPAVFRSGMWIISEEISTPTEGEFKWQVNSRFHFGQAGDYPIVIGNNIGIYRPAGGQWKFGEWDGSTMVYYEGLGNIPLYTISNPNNEFQFGTIDDYPIVISNNTISTFRNGIWIVGNTFTYNSSFNNEVQSRHNIIQDDENIVLFPETIEAKYFMFNNFELYSDKDLRLNMLDLLASVPFPSDEQYTVWNRIVPGNELGNMIYTGDPPNYDDAFVLYQPKSGDGVIVEFSEIRDINGIALYTNQIPAIRYFESNYFSSSSPDPIEGTGTGDLEDLLNFSEETYWEDDDPDEDSYIQLNFDGLQSLIGIKVHQLPAFGAEKLKVEALKNDVWELIDVYDSTIDLEEYIDKLREIDVGFEINWTDDIVINDEFIIYLDQPYKLNKILFHFVSSLTSISKFELEYKITNYSEWIDFGEEINCDHVESYSIGRSYRDIREAKLDKMIVASQLKIKSTEAPYSYSPPNNVIGITETKINGIESNYISRVAINNIDFNRQIFANALRITPIIFQNINSWRIHGCVPFHFNSAGVTDPNLVNGSPATKIDIEVSVDGIDYTKVKTFDKKLDLWNINTSGNIIKLFDGVLQPVKYIKLIGREFPFDWWNISYFFAYNHTQIFHGNDVVKFDSGGNFVDKIVDSNNKSYMKYPISLHISHLDPDYMYIGYDNGILSYNLDSGIAYTIDTDFMTDITSKVCPACESYDITYESYGIRLQKSTRYIWVCHNINCNGVIENYHLLWASGEIFDDKYLFHTPKHNIYVLQDTLTYKTIHNPDNIDWQYCNIALTTTGEIIVQKTQKVIVDSYDSVWNYYTLIKYFDSSWRVDINDTTYYNKDFNILKDNSNNLYYYVKATHRVWDQIHNIIKIYKSNANTYGKGWKFVSNIDKDIKDLSNMIWSDNGVYIIDGMKIYKSDDGITNWREIANESGNDYIVIGCKQNGNFYYIKDDKKVYKSENEGGTKVQIGDINIHTDCNEENIWKNNPKIRTVGNLLIYNSETIPCPDMYMLNEDDTWRSSTVIHEDYGAWHRPIRQNSYRETNIFYLDEKLFLINNMTASIMWLDFTAIQDPPNQPMWNYVSRNAMDGKMIVTEDKNGDDLLLTFFPDGKILVYSTSAYYSSKYIYKYEEDKDDLPVKKLENSRGIALFEDYNKYLTDGVILFVTDEDFIYKFALDLGENSWTFIDQFTHDNFKMLEKFKVDLYEDCMYVADSEAHTIHKIDGIEHYRISDVEFEESAYIGEMFDYRVNEGDQESIDIRPFLKEEDNILRLVQPHKDSKSCIPFVHFKYSKF